ncbi:hypothetical protein EV645_6511 [Kribbella rubisoli]|uniref:DUF1273 family protein n=1 Tax=Kribbella rubisoli TaxID=3075929 RepID=A0A4Q7WPD2_9ACTN|nr:hypothetical protein [Kribbella rubisoli]RZU11345.1 hypothetical protein EV645_6511 [Kribbella rubisoli]
MTKVGVTGHRGLPSTAETQARRDLRQLLRSLPAPVLGLSSLAIGADQLFAELTLELGGALHAIIPAADFETTFAPRDQARYLDLLSQADEVTVLDFLQSTDEAYDAAGRFIVDHCDTLFAVWDGEPARGPGGTADAVSYARSVGREVLISWPHGVLRETEA